MNAQQKVKGRWAVVTGGSSGIGLAYCRRLARWGCNVVMVSNQPQQLAEAAQTLRREFGIEAWGLNLDLSLADAPRRVMDFLGEKAVEPLILINNAGIFDFSRFDALSPRRIELYIDLHCRAVAQLTRLVAQGMASRGEGYVLTMSSMSCWMPVPGIAMYSATKAFSRAFCRALSGEMRSRGVRVMVAAPGAIATGLFGLSPSLLRLGVRLGVITNPDKFSRRALRRLLRGRSLYVNGWLNRLAIPLVGGTPQWLRRLFSNKIVDRHAAH